MISLFHHQRWPVRRISRELKISRNRVRRILASNGKSRDTSAATPVPQKKEQTSKLDPYKEIIAALIQKYPKITAQRVYESLVEKGYDGSLTICRDFVRSLRGSTKKKTKIIMVETDPGQRAANDWSEYYIPFTVDGQKHKVIFFSYILCFSRRQYIVVVEDKTQQTLFRELIAAFIYMDGIPREIKADNQKACVDRWEPGNPQFNRTYLEFATFYRFKPLTITPYTPVENLKIERPFWYLEQSFLNGRDFKDLEDLKSQLQNWLTNVNDVRIHGTTNRRPIDLYAEELPHLQALPTTHYDTAAMAHRVVSIESCVYWEGYHYVVPRKYISNLCTVRVTTDQLIVYSPRGEQIACHPLAEKGRKERYVGQHRRSATLSDPDIDDVIQRLESFSPDMHLYIDQIKQHKRRSWRNHLTRLLALKIDYQVEDIVQAVRRARKYKIFDCGPIETFLKNNSEPRYIDKTFLKPRNNNNE